MKERTNVLRDHGEQTAFGRLTRSSNTTHPRRLPSSALWALAAMLAVGLAPFHGVVAQDLEEDKVARVELLSTSPESGLQNPSGPTEKISIDVRDRPLKQVLDFLSTVSGLNIRALSEQAERLSVTVNLKDVTYRTVLDFIGKKYGLQIDDSRLQSGVILLSIPEKVSMVFRRADIRDVINTIAIQANANIVVGPEVTGEISMRLEDVPWHEALDIVVKTLDFVTVKEANDTIRITTPDKLRSQLQARIFRLAYLTPEGTKYTATLETDFAQKEQSKEVSALGTTLIDLLGQMKTEQGRVSFVKRGNSLVVTDTPTKLDEMQAVITKLDVAPKQIHVSVKIVSVSDGDVERLGVNWSNGLQFQINPLSMWPSAFPFDVTEGLSRSFLGQLAIGQGARTQIDRTTGNAVAINDIFSYNQTIRQGGDPIAGDAGVSLSTPTPITLGNMGFGATNAFFEMLRTKTSSRIIQSPQLMTLDNEEATIHVGDQVRFAESFVANTEGGGNVAGFREASGSPINTGTQLLIIPHVTGPENNILLTAIPKTEELINFEEFVGPDGTVLRLPQTRQRIVVTKMLLRNGETGVIGGLRVEQDVRSQNHLPILSEIPILGRLFKHRSRTVTGDTVMVFVTPTIVDLEKREDFRTQLDSLRAEISKPFAPAGDDDTTGGVAAPYE